MFPHPNSDLNPLVRKLESIVVLTEEERQATLRLPVTVRALKADQDIVRDQDRPSQCCLILKGSPAGTRWSGMVSGRFCPSDHNLGTVTATTVAFIPHDVVRAFIRAHPRIGDVFWRETLIDAAVFREWVTNVSRREAYARLAHVFCELFVRVRAVGLNNGESYGMPITQAELADATGLSTVHVNRTMQELRGDGLIKTENGRVVIEDWEGLQEAGEFDATYLHVRKQAA